MSEKKGESREAERIVDEVVGKYAECKTCLGDESWAAVPPALRADLAAAMDERYEAGLLHGMKHAIKRLLVDARLTTSDLLEDKGE